MRHTTRKAKIISVIFSILVPGLGHVVIRRPFKGFFLSLSFAVSVQVLLYVVLLKPLKFSFLIFASMLAPAVIYVVAQVLLLLDIRRLCEVAVEERKAIFKDVLKHLLADRLDEALLSIEKVLSVNADDVDAHFHKGHILALKGESQEARREFQRCLDLDDSGKWNWEIGRELERLKVS